MDTLPDPPPPFVPPSVTPPVAPPAPSQYPRHPSAEIRTQVAGESPASAAESLAAGTLLGRYELREELGRGGMGVVYLAWDTQLKREVALKLLASEGGVLLEQVKRFHREAEAAARLSHPHIVATYDVGVVDGRHFFTMEVVPGGSVAERLRRERRLRPYEAMRLVREAAEGVHHAHAQGIVHRDLKPENLLLDAQGTVKVSDFGLARMMTEPGLERLTRTGAVMGTPTHMAPEQAEGDVGAIDARTDVYSLGSILYELTTGRPPYDGTNPMEVLFRKVAKDAVPPRRVNAELAPDVETIILKGMEREPAARYPSAQALADDLRRCLEGQVILARPASGLHRAWKWTARNRLATVAMAGAGMALLFAGVWSWRESEHRAAALREVAEADRRTAEARERAETSRRAVVEQLRTVSAVSLEAVLGLRREGIVRGREAFAAHLTAAYERAAREAPELAEPPYHMARLERALLRWDSARDFAERALACDPGYAPARYERALLSARRLALRLGRLRDAWMRREGARLAAGGMLQAGGLAAGSLRLPPPTPELIGTDPEARDLRDAIAEDLAVLENSAGDALPAASLECVRGLALLYGAATPEEVAEARRRLELALAAEPRLEEAVEGLAQLHLALGDADRSIETYGRGIEADRGYVPHWIGRAGAHLARGWRRASGGQDPRDDHRLAAADYGRATELQPDLVEAWTGRGSAWINLAAALDERGEDPGECFTRAEEDLSRAIELAPDDPGGVVRRGLARANAALSRARRGEVPDPLYARALEDYDRAVVLGPAWYEAWAGRAAMRANWGNHATSRGLDPREHYRAADADLGRALEIAPQAADGWLHRGLVRANWGVADRQRGADPEERYAGAHADYDRSIQLEPNAWMAWMRRGMLATNRALHEGQRGRDPHPFSEAAERDLTRAVELNPGATEAWCRRGDYFCNRGVAERARGIDPTASYRRAEADYERTLALHPRLAEAWRQRAMVRMNLGVFQEALGEDPAPVYGPAEEDYGKALELNPRDAEAWKGRGALRMNWGAFQALHGVDPEEKFRAAREDLDAAVRHNPAWAEAWTARGDLMLNWGAWQHQAGRDPGERYAEAIADYGRALERNPRSLPAWIRRGTLGVNWGLFRMSRGDDPTEQFGQAETDLSKALEVHPGSVEAWLNRGDARLNAGVHRAARGEDPVESFRDAEADYTRAMDATNAGAAASLRRGTARLQWGFHEKGKGREPAPLFEGAHVDFERALQAEPANAEARARRGWARYGLARWAEAVQDFEAAAKQQPALAPGLAQALEDARTHLGGK